MEIKLSNSFTYGRLFRFAMPSVIMMLFSSIYGVVDGLFVSNFVGKTEFAAINLLMPVLMIIGAFGFMIGAGGTAVVSKTLGEGEEKLANRYFSLFVYLIIIVGASMSLLGVIFIRPLSMMLGAEGAMLDACIRYGRIVLAAMPFFMLQNLFQSFMIVAERPKLGLAVTVCAGVTNMILDALLILVIPLGLEGAALATSISQLVGGIIPVVYFASKNSSQLSLTKTKFYGKAFIRAVANGSSELMSNISMSIVTIVYNFQLMRLIGEDGVAANGIIMYVAFIFIAMFLGFAVGTAPIIGYHYGAKNTDELGSLLRKGSTVMLVAGLTMSVISIVLANPLATIFAGYDPELVKITANGLRIHSTCFAFASLGIFGSSYFTALNNGLISAIISFTRTLVFQIGALLLLPIFLDLNGVWLATPVSEVLSLTLTVILFIANRKKYKYF